MTPSLSLFLSCFHYSLFQLMSLLRSLLFLSISPYFSSHHHPPLSLYFCSPSSSLSFPLIHRPLFSLPFFSLSPSVSPGVHVFGLCATALMTDVIQLATGYHTPFFLTVCKPNYTQPGVACDKNPYITKDICSSHDQHAILSAR